MELTLNQLRCFREVARQGQFTRAAEALHVSQPAVSKRVKDLERQVGAVLFEPMGRQVRLTEVGRLLLPHAERVLAELADVERALSGLLGGETGRLVIGASSTPGTYLLPPLLGAFRRAHPGVEAALEIGDTGQVLERLLQGSLDLGFVGEARFDPALRAEIFRTDTLVLITSPGHPLLWSPRITPRALDGRPFVFRERGSSTREVLERALAAAGVVPRMVMELGSTEAVKKTVAAGLGVSMVSEHAVLLEEAAGVLAVRRVTGLAVRRGIYAVRRRTLPLTPLHRKFLDLLAAAETGEDWEERGGAPAPEGRE